MRPHTRIYLDYFGYSGYEYIKCEIPECHERVVDINHIDCKGMGGSKTKDYIENLIGLCRDHHNEFGDISDKKDWLREIHWEFMHKNKSSLNFRLRRK